MAKTNFVSDKVILKNIQGQANNVITIGKNVLQITARNGLVNISTQHQNLQPFKQNKPLNLQPLPTSPLLAREAEIRAVITALQNDEPVTIYGQAGIGKTALLYHLAQHPFSTKFSDGVIYINQAMCQPYAIDLLQFIYDLYYQTNPDYKPQPLEFEQALHTKRVLILLDELPLAYQDILTLCKTMPHAQFISALSDRPRWDAGQVVTLLGLPLVHALALVEQEIKNTLNHTLTEKERSLAQNLCNHLKGNPWYLLQAIRLMHLNGYALADIPLKGLGLEIIASCTEEEKRILTTLAALNGAFISANHLATVAKITNINPVLKTLVAHNLLHTHNNLYSLARPLIPVVTKLYRLNPLLERMLNYFTTQAEQHHHNPEYILAQKDATLYLLHWAVQTEHWHLALRLIWAIENSLILAKQWGAWGQVLQWGLQAARILQNKAAEAWCLHQIGTRALCLKESTTANSALNQAYLLRKTLHDKAGVTATGHNLSFLK